MTSADIDAPRAGMCHLLDFIHQVWWEDSDLLVWSESRFADIAAHARTWEKEYMAELTDEDEQE